MCAFIFNRIRSFGICCSLSILSWLYTHFEVCVATKKNAGIKFIRHFYPLKMRTNTKLLFCAHLKRCCQDSEVSVELHETLFRHVLQQQMRDIQMKCSDNCTYDFITFNFSFNRHAQWMNSSKKCSMILNVSRIDHFFNEQNVYLVKSMGNILICGGF